MKTMKKVFALALALIMVLGLSVTAFAEDTETPTTGSITVKNADSTATYKAYKIFDVTYNTDQTAYSYTISKDSAWLDTIIAYIGGYTKVGDVWYASKDVTNGSANEGATAATEFTSDTSGLTLTLSADKTKYVVTIDDTAFSAADFAQALYAALEGYTVVDTTTTTTPVSGTTYYTHEDGQYVEHTELTSFVEGTTYYTKGDGLTTVTGTELTNNNGTATASNLDLGYYFVTSTLGSLANLTTTDPDVTIYDKNEQPPFDKTVDDADVEIGQTVNYTITGEVPSTTGYTTYTYKVSDTLGEGLTFNKDVKVSFGDTEITSLDTKLVYNTAGDGFVLTFDMTDYQDYVGQTITITYSAVVNENAVVPTEGNPNNATLVYSNDPNDTTSTDTETDIVKVYTVDLTIDKYAKNAEDETDKSTKLSGAEFVLVKQDATTNTETFYQAVYAYTYTSGGDNVTVYSADGKTYYSDVNLENKDDDVTTDTELTKGSVVKVNWVKESADATSYTTNDNGEAKFEGIEAGLKTTDNPDGAVYYLREITAPDGYNLLTYDVEVKIQRTETPETNGTVTVTIAGNEVSVANSAGTALPETGGIGTTIFYVVGSILVIGAAILLITKKRMSGSAE